MSDFQSPDWSPTDSEQAKASDYKTNAGGYDYNDLGTVRALLKHTMMERDQHWNRIAALEAENARLQAVVKAMCSFFASASAWACSGVIAECEEASDE